MSGLTLFEIASQYQADLRVLEELDIDEQTFLDTLEGLSGDLEVKAKNVAMFAKNLQANADAIKQAEDAMVKRRKAIENKVSRLTDYLLHNLQACGISKIDSPYLSIAVRKNPESLIVDFEGSIPDGFYIQPPTPPKVLDKRLLKEAIKNGAQYEGVHLESKFRLDIK